MKYVILILFVLQAHLAYAEHPENDNASYRCDVNCVAPNSWALGLGLGYGKLVNPLYDGKDKNLAVLPSFYFYGDAFYIENSTLGYVLHESDLVTFKLEGMFNTDGLYFNDSLLDPFFISAVLGPGNFEGGEHVSANEVERDYSYMGGAAIDYFFNDFVSVSSGIYYDLTKVHHGYQFNISTHYTYAANNWQFNASIGANYSSQNLNNYYYGLREEDLTSYADFVLDDNLNVFLSLTYDYRISTNLSLIARFHQTWFGSGMTVSPLVEKHQSAMFFIGISTKFGHD